VKLFLDLDGVLADFDRGILALTGKRPAELSSRALWRAAARAPDFFAKLAFTRDGRRLWDYCRPLHPTILTGLPLGDWAPAQKRRWVATMLGPAVPVITCLSREKPRYAAPGHVLVDDREAARAGWEGRGGIFIHHVDAERSIAALRGLRLHEYTRCTGVRPGRARG
jgi:hypothetical protein